MLKVFVQSLKQELGLTFDSFRTLMDVCRVKVAQFRVLPEQVYPQLLLAPPELFRGFGRVFRE